VVFLFNSTNITVTRSDKVRLVVVAEHLTAVNANNAHLPAESDHAYAR